MTCVSRSKDESSRIAEFLIKFKHTFSKDEFVLGLTSLVVVEHEIYVCVGGGGVGGGDKNIKQPPRQ